MAAPAKASTDASRSVYVGKLALSTTEANLRALFGSVGRITKVDLPAPLPERDSRIAWVEFEDAAAVAAATSKDGAELNGQAIRVAQQRPPRERRTKEEIVGERDPLTVYVAGIPRGATEERVRELFAHAGAISRVRLPARGMMGFGYVTFETEAAATAAIGKHGQDFEGRSLVVDLALARRRRASRSGGAAAAGGAGAGAARPARREGGAARPARAPRKDSDASGGRRRGRRLTVIGTESLSEEQVQAGVAAFGAVVRVTKLSKYPNTTWVFFDAPEGVDAALAAKTATIAGQTVDLAIRPPRTRRASVGGGAGAGAARPARREGGAARPAREARPRREGAASRRPAADDAERTPGRTRRLIVLNTNTLTADDVRGLVNAFGAVSDVEKLDKYPATRVFFEAPEGVDAALARKNATIKGVNVEFSLRLPARPRDNDA